MAYPSSPCGASAQAGAASQIYRQALPVSRCDTKEGECHSDHLLEKLEFALAVALTRGDLRRSEQLRLEIDSLGGNREEPGT